ncbi:hypothetical protein LZ31DRAFT_578981 [Colletotrichum somersetense]|nr:hypothetical protein LZ31DRAFT_578981 [Colletotrichum somersetense]
MATYTLAADPKQHPDWHVPYEDEPLPIHELPECVQSCLNEKNGRLNFDIYTLPRGKFCRDEFDTFFTWWTYHAGDCVRAACNGDSDSKKTMGWQYKMCGYPKSARYSGVDDWKTLPPDDLM